MHTHEKHKKDSIEADIDKLNNSLQTLTNAVNALPAKQQNIIADWFFAWAKYLNHEKSFDRDG